MAHRGNVTLFTPSGEKITWKVDAEPVFKDGCCTFMQDVNGMPTRVRVMGTVVSEVYDTRDEAPGMLESEGEAL